MHCLLLCMTYTITDILNSENYNGFVLTLPFYALLRKLVLKTNKMFRYNKYTFMLQTVYI